MYRKSIRLRRLDAKRQRCAAMRAAKERKRLAVVETIDWVGRIRFDGPMFGGCEHVIRVAARGDDAALLVEVDGRPFRPLTLRGLRGILARRLWRSAPCVA